jgi:uncharacterized protein (DUF697 family)/tellurite resistance protein
MNPEQQQAVLTLALLAAFADGANDESEREQIHRLAETLDGRSGALDLPALYQQVLLKRVTLGDAAAVLVEPAHRQLAYETAVCVCDADGAMNAAEQKFLTDLATALGLDNSVTVPVNQQAEAMASGIGGVVPEGSGGTAVGAVVPSMAAALPVAEAEVDRSILNYAILNGALELLPHSWATMAVIPLQIKMVHGIGKMYGYELDQGRIRELLATLGVGLTSQYLEQFGRKLLGGLLGMAAGSLGKQFGSAATGVAFSFATTYALGRVAKAYYAGGRQMSTGLLRDTFQSLLGPAKEMQAQYLPQIQQKAGSLDVGQVMAMVRGS